METLNKLLRLFLLKQLKVNYNSQFIFLNILKFYLGLFLKLFIITKSTRTNFSECCF